MKTNERRRFLKQVAAGAALAGTGILAAPMQLMAAENVSSGTSDADEWFKQIKGKHRIAFDATRPNGIFPFAWPKVFLLTNQATGTPEKDSTAVVILRHEAIPFALQSSLWEKYKFGEMFKITDEKTSAPSVRNVFWKPEPGDYKVPGIGPVPIGINELQASGVMFCACDMAITVYSAVIAEKTNQDAKVVHKEWLDNLLPGVQPVPSGVWAVGRAQEHGCAYCYAG